MNLIVFNGIVLLLLIPLLLLLSAILPPDSPWAPWWQMPEDVIYRMCRLSRANKNSRIYDLGSGTGKALLIAAKEFGAFGVGIEIDPLRFYTSYFYLWRSGQRKRVQFVKKNFFAVSLAQATIIFMYLVPNALKRLSKKFSEELQDGTILVSYIYPLPLEAFAKNIVLISSQDDVYVYRYKRASKKRRKNQRSLSATA